MEDKWRCPRCTISFLKQRPAFGNRTEVLICPEKNCHVRFGNCSHENERGLRVKPACRMWLEGAQI